MTRPVSCVLLERLQLTTRLIPSYNPVRNNAILLRSAQRTGAIQSRAAGDHHFFLSFLFEEQEREREKTAIIQFDWKEERNASAERK